MSEHKIKAKIDCFGTIDKKNKEGCNTCENNTLCEIFKPKLEEHKAQAEEKGRLDYIKKMTATSSATNSKYTIYAILVAVMLFLLWMLLQEKTAILINQ